MYCQIGVQPEVDEVEEVAVGHQKVVHIMVVVEETQEDQDQVQEEGLDHMKLDFRW